METLLRDRWDPSLGPPGTLLWDQGPCSVTTGDPALGPPATLWCRDHGAAGPAPSLRDVSSHSVRRVAAPGGGGLCCQPRVPIVANVPIFAHFVFIGSAVDGGRALSVCVCVDPAGDVSWLPGDPAGRPYLLRSTVHTVCRQSNK